MKVLLLKKCHPLPVNRKISLNQNLSNSISSVIILANFFGLLPIEDVKKATFSRKSIKFIYSVYNLITAGFIALLSLIHYTYDGGFTLDKTVKFVFYSCAFFATWELILIAQKWKIFTKDWSYMEMTFRNYKSTSNLNRRFFVMTFTVLTLAIVEHVLFVFNNLTLTYGLIKNNEVSAILPTYYRLAHPQIFVWFEYSWLRALFIEQVNLLTTFTWNFTDLFIMLLSSALALRFKQINKRLATQKSQIQERYWREIREDYNRLSGLCHNLDNFISRLVLISFANNLVFICVQLYNSLKPRYYLIESVYFFYSFGFLVCRTAAVSLYAAWINDESKEPLRFLHSVSSEYYFAEISRFTNQIHIDPIAISGCNFFLLTRNFVLKLTGTIVTLELMLLQFGPLINGEETSK